MKPPPFDRAIALACSLRTLRGRWLELSCGCGASEALPIRVMLRDDPNAAMRTLAEAVVLARCSTCGARPAAVALAEDGRGAALEGQPAWCRPTGWRLDLWPDSQPLLP